MSELRAEIIRQITDDPIKGAATLCELQEDLTAALAKVDELEDENTRVKDILDQEREGQVRWLKKIDEIKLLLAEHFPSVAAAPKKEGE